MGGRGRKIVGTRDEGREGERAKAGAESRLVEEGYKLQVAGCRL